jgi:hypothetical protein
MDPKPFLDLIAKHEWVGLAAVLIGFAVRLMKEAVRFPPWAVRARWRPLLAVGLGVLSGALQAASTGTPWRDAMLGGLVSGFVAIAGHEAIVGSIRNGKDVPLPGLMKVPLPPDRGPKPEPPTPVDPSVPRA